MTDARDVAAVAARTLLDAVHPGKAYDITGPEALSHAEACEKRSARLGRPVRYVPVDDEAAGSAALAAGLNRWMTDAPIGLYQDHRRSGTGGYAAQVADTVPAVTGRPAHTLDQALANDFGEPATLPGS